MRSNAPAVRRLPARTALLAALAVVVLATSGCGWFRKDAAMYALAPADRPLEVPPELVVAADGTAPQADGAPVLRSTTGARPSANAAASAPGLGFNVALPRDQAYARVGDALEAIDGLEVASRAQLLGAFDVSYRGSDFLVRVTPVEAGTYVSAVDPRGLPAAGDNVSALMAALKAALGGN